MENRHNAYLQMATVEFKKAAELTQEFCKQSGGKIRWLKASILVMAIFLAGVSTRFIWPHQVVLEKPIIKEVQIEKIHWKVIDAKQPTLANALEEGRFGVLMVMDGQAKTVLKNRAAVGSKHGFWDLRNDIIYTIHNYAFFQNTGYGIVSDDESNFFFLVWQTGQTPAPITNPKTIFVPSGRKIAIGNP